jgi:hypothetical protein
VLVGLSGRGKSGGRHGEGRQPKGGGGGGKVGYWIGAKLHLEELTLEMRQLTTFHYDLMIQPMNS